MINPPTDNLYKFCAIIGIFLVIFNAYYGQEMLIKTNTELAELLGEQKKYSLQVKIFGQKNREFREKLKIAINKKKDLIEKQRTLHFQKNKISKNQIKDLEIKIKLALSDQKQISKSLDSLYKITSKKSEELQFKQIEIDNKNDLIKIQDRRSKTYSKYMWFGIIIGFILSIYGFFNWIKIQKAIDKELFK